MHIKFTHLITLFNYKIYVTKFTILTIFKYIYSEELSTFTLLYCKSSSDKIETVSINHQLPSAASAAPATTATIFNLLRVYKFDTVHKWNHAVLIFCVFHLISLRFSCIVA